MRLVAAALAAVGVLTAACSGDGGSEGVGRTVEAAVDKALPFDFVVRADILAEEGGEIRCASRMLATTPADAHRMSDVDRAYLVAACAGRTEQAVANKVPPVCLVAPVVAVVDGRKTLGPSSFVVLDWTGDRLRQDVDRYFPAQARDEALRASELAAPLWKRLGQDPDRCGR